MKSVGETYEKALNHGAEKLGEIVEKKVPDVGVLKFVYFRDPEGNIVEIQSWDYSLNARSRTAALRPVFIFE